MAAKVVIAGKYTSRSLGRLHTNTDMGCSDSQSADNGSVEKHQEALCILASCFHGTAYAYVLRRFYRLYGKSRENLE